MIYDTFPDLITAYLEEHLSGRASHAKMCHVASQWVGTLTTTPTRAQLLARQRAVCAGHCQPGATKANKELALVSAACRWGMYQERWEGGDPTAGIKKWKIAKRKRTGKFEELRTLLGYFARASSEVEIRDRALYGLMLFTGCRPSEARTARLDAMTPYGQMGAWIKGTTKTGETQELPLPMHLMPWLAAWKAIRPNNVSPYLFPGQWMGEAITSDLVRLRWHELRLILGISGLWNYDLRRTLASYLSNDLQVDDVTIRAILNHSDGSALGHYCFKSFDSLTGPIQRYADWLCALQGSTGLSREPASPSAVPPARPAPSRPAPVYTPPPVREPARQSAMRPLTGRERQILALIAEGRSYQEIADTLTLSIPTVGCYRGRLLDRLQLTTTGELIAYARAHALTTLPMLVIKRGRVRADRTPVTII